jgi:pyruvate/2-oxoacid:ferredoxin oxidoreductase beta subunit
MGMRPGEVCGLTWHQTSQYIAIDSEVYSLTGHQTSKAYFSKTYFGHAGT